MIWLKVTPKESKVVVIREEEKTWNNIKWNWNDCLLLPVEMNEDKLLWIMDCGQKKKKRFAGKNFYGQWKQRKKQMAGLDLNYMFPGRDNEEEEFSDGGNCQGGQLPSTHIEKNGLKNLWLCRSQDVWSWK